MTIYFYLISLGDMKFEQMFVALESFTALPRTREINGFKNCITLMFIHVRFYLDVNVYGCNFCNAVLLQ